MKQILNNAMAFTSSDLQSLANLLNTEENLDSEDDYEYGPINKNCQQHHVTPEINTIYREKNEEKSACNKIVKDSSKDIWDENEIIDEEEDEMRNKEKPEYDMMYQQNVTPDDVFLRLSGKGPGSDSCECLLIKIKLPGVLSKDEVDLNISPLKLVCKTKKHYLGLDLPREVNPVQSSAKWDLSHSLLVIKLVMDSEYKLIF